MKRMGFAMVAIALSAWTLTPGDAFAQQSLGPTMSGSASGSISNQSMPGREFNADAGRSDLERAEQRASEIGRRYGQNIPSSEMSLSSHDTVLLIGLGVSGEIEGQEMPGSFTVTRFGLDESGRLVAHGVVTPTPMTSSMALVVRDPSIDVSRLSLHERALLLSSPIERSEFDYTPEELGLSSHVEYDDAYSEGEIRGLVGDGSGMPMDEHDIDMSMMQGGWGGWTGIGTGYGESGAGASVSAEIASGEISGLADDEMLYVQPSLGLAWRSEADARIVAPSLSLNIESEFEDDEYLLTEDEIILTSPYSLQYASAPVSIIGASCEGLTLGFGDMTVAGTSMSFDEGMVTIMAEPGNERLNSTLCAIADGQELTGEQVEVLVDPLNGLIMTVD